MKHLTHKIAADHPDEIAPIAGRCMNVVSCVEIVGESIRKAGEVVGLTSPRNRAFVERLGCYDRVVPSRSRAPDPLAGFHAAVREWFSRSFASPTRAQVEAWPVIARGDHTLLLAPTGSGKTLAAFLWCLNRLMFVPVPDSRRGCRGLYVSPSCPLLVAGEVIGMTAVLILGGLLTFTARVAGWFVPEVRRA